jgi:hypothetical protein
MVMLCSCTINTNITGKYASNKKPYGFEFRSDSTFLYEYGEFELYKYSSGTWSPLNKHTIILNSKIKNTTIPIKVNEDDINNSKKSVLSIALSIDGELNLPDYKCHIYINDTLYEVKRCDSLSLIQINSPIRNVYFQIERHPIVVNSTFISLPLITEGYTPKRSICNLKIEASFKDSLFSYQSFNNERLKLKRDMIKIFSPFTKKWEGIPKVSASTNIFVHFR